MPIITVNKSVNTLTYLTITLSTLNSKLLKRSCSKNLILSIVKQMITTEPFKQSLKEINTESLNRRTNNYFTQLIKYGLFSYSAFIIQVEIEPGIIKHLSWFKGDKTYIIGNITSQDLIQNQDAKMKVIRRISKDEYTIDNTDIVKLDKIKKSCHQIINQTNVIKNQIDFTYGL
jgi:hypothetical protein